MILRANLLLVLIGHVLADIYLHNPRGSNNRLNENTATRKNANRMFDSQNNNRGGYNVGDATDKASGNNESKQYNMKYFQSSRTGKSYLSVEWTNQHGCGGNEDSSPQKQNCALILQYMCQDETTTEQDDKDRIRNGVTTATQDYTAGSPPETESAANRRKNNQVKPDRGLHEPWKWYEKCYMRDRNQGLFTADQKLKKDKATYTRQNPNGNQYGYECPEERDYFPYWHPTPWKDIAVLAENSSMCSFYKQNSFNVKSRYECVEKYKNSETFGQASRWNNQADCESNGGQWREFHNYLEKAPQHSSESACTRASGNGVQYVWGLPHDATNLNKQCLVKLSQPECREAPWSRSNHLGNGVDGRALNYSWTLPYFPSGHTQRCVFRIRYNVTTDDYDPYNTDSKYNGKEKSPVTNDPYVEIGVGRSTLRLNINTNQTGRIFQDRSHVFLLRPRPSNIQGEVIHNLNVRGKRGNIVQTYPAVEYDFHPNNLKIQQGELVHIQWTGSNTHNNGGNGGDGQAGDDGEGARGTDRNNLVEIRDRNENFPVPFEQNTMWRNVQIKWIYHGETSVSSEDLALNMASSGYYRCMRSSNCPGSNNADYSVDTLDRLQKQLNNAPASYEGAVLRFSQGVYHYMCTRNNNFTNRSQKGTIVVS